MLYYFYAMSRGLHISWRLLHDTDVKSSQQDVGIGNTGAVNTLFHLFIGCVKKCEQLFMLFFCLKSRFVSLLNKLI